MRLVFKKQLDQNVRDRLSVPADADNVLVRKTIGLIAKQLATALDRDVLRGRRRKDLFHPHTPNPATNKMRSQSVGVRALECVSLRPTHS